MSNKIFRSTSVLFSAVLFLLIAVANSRAAATSNSQAIRNKISGFYSWYVGELIHDRLPSKNAEKIRSHSSARLWKWLHSKEGRELDGDYFTDAQDFGPDWNYARVSNFRVHGRTASMKVTLGKPHKGQRDDGMRYLDVKLVKEAGAWKIDQVRAI
jgi:hypothetical protein